MEVTSELLEKYVNGECSEAEKTAVREWLITADENEDILIGIPFSPELEARLRKKFKKNITNNMKEKKSSISFRFVWGVAASLALVVGLGAFFLFFNKYTSYRTESGELKTLTLVDGTRVVLNTSSRLNVPKQFGKGDRTVLLEGEAFFEVAKDSLQPFIVQTSASKTQVFGTAFNLSAYPNEAIILTLTEGKVSFSKNVGGENSRIDLLPNEQVVLKDGFFKKLMVDPSFSKAWMERKLVFRGQPFSEVAREIERFYGIRIKIERDGLEKRLYRGTHDNPSLKTLMKKMSFVLKFKYRAESRTLIIY